MKKDLSDKIVKELQTEVENNDTETAHNNADEILCNLLLELGYKEVVEKYNDVSKWYAQQIMDLRNPLKIFLGGLT